MPASLLIATSNPAKAERFRRLFEGLPVQLYLPSDLPEAADVLEEGSAHLAVACGKAVAWSMVAKGLAVASDGGVDIPVLGSDWQSVTTRRATGEHATDEERAARLLRLLQGFPERQREAWWTEAVAVARDGVLLAGYEARGLRGLLTDGYLPAPAEFQGFWVYGMWLFPQFGKRYWEMTDAELREASEPWFQVQPWLLELVGRLVRE
jgi:inosine/xanthosine triphosphate pyrophosphatase family protein